MQLKSFCTAKEIVNWLKKTPTKWERIFAIYTSDRILISKIDKELKTNNKNGPFEN